MAGTDEQKNGAGSIPPPSLDPVEPSGDEPDDRTFFEIPVTSIIRRDKRGAVASVLAKLKEGDFRDASHLAEDILSDDRVYSCLNTRVNGLIGTPMAFRPALPTRKARKIAEAFEDTDERRGLWNRMFPPSEIAELLRWGVLLGVGVAEVTWDTVEDADLWIPRLKVWHPSALRWQWDYSSPDSGAYWLSTATPDQGDIRIQPGGGRWVLYLPYAQRRAWLRGVLPCLGELFLGRRWTMGTDWPRYNEVHGLPIRLAEVPENASNADKKEYYRSIKNLNNEGTVRVSKGANGGWGLSLVEAKADTFNAFKEYLIKAEASISIAILGTDINNIQASGVVAHQKAAEQIRDDYRRMDASTIPRTLYEQVLGWFAHYNFGDADLAPRPEYLVDPPQDGQARSLELVNLSTAFATFRTASVPVDFAAILDEHNVPTLAEEDIEEMLPPAPAAEGDEEQPAGAEPEGGEKPAEAPRLELTPSDLGIIVKVKEARASIGLGPLTLPGGGYDPDNDLTIAEYKAKHAPVVGAAAAAEGGETEIAPKQKGEPAEEPEAKDEALRWLGDYETHGEPMLRAVMLRARGVVALASRRPSPKPYPLRLAENARTYGSKALRPDLLRVLRIVEQSKDPDDLRRRLRKLYVDMKVPGTFAKLVERALILAEMRGRVDVLGE